MYKRLLTVFIAILSMYTNDWFTLESEDMLLQSYSNIVSKGDKKELGKLLGNIGRSIFFGKDTNPNIPKAFLYFSIAAHFGDTESDYYIYLMKSFSLDPLAYFNFRKVSLKHLVAANKIKTKDYKGFEVCTRSFGQKLLKNMIKGTFKRHIIDKLTLRLIVQERIKTMTQAIYKAAVKNDIKANLYIGNIFYDVS